MKVVKKIGNVIINILIVMVLLVSVVIAALALTSKANGGVPSILGYSFHTIQTQSMEGGSEDFDGGDYLVGDLVIGKVTNSNPNEVYEVGDIVVYTKENEDAPNGVMMIVHRVIKREEVGGAFAYVTKGDNNDIADDGQRSASDIVAVCYDRDYQGAVIKGFGSALDFIRTPTGFFFVVLVPMIIFFLYEIIRVVMNTLNYKKAKSEEEKENAEKEKQEAVQAAVAAALAAVKNEDEPKAEPAPAAETAPVAETPAAPAAPAAQPDMSAEQMEQFKQFLAFQEAQKNAAKNEE